MSPPTFSRPPGSVRPRRVISAATSKPIGALAVANPNEFSEAPQLESPPEPQLARNPLPMLERAACEKLETSAPAHEELTAPNQLMNSFQEERAPSASVSEPPKASEPPRNSDPTPPPASKPLDNSPEDQNPRASADQLVRAETIQLESSPANFSAKPADAKFQDPERISPLSSEKALKRLLSALPSCRRATNSPSSPELRRSRSRAKIAECNCSELHCPLVISRMNSLPSSATRIFLSCSMRKPCEEPPAASSFCISAIAGTSAAALAGDPEIASTSRWKLRWSGSVAKSNESESLIRSRGVTVGADLAIEFHLRDR